MEDVGAEDNDCYVNLTWDEEDIPFEELFGKNTEIGKYIFETCRIIDPKDRKRLCEMMQSLPLDEIIAFCRELREDVMFNVLDISMDSACHIDDSNESDNETSSFTDIPLYDEFDEGYYSETDTINVFRTSMTAPGAEITLEVTVNGKKLTGIIDTGAMKSCLKTSLLPELSPVPYLGKPVRLVGIKPNEPVAGHLSSVNLTIGKYQYKQNIVVANIPNDFILGADFLAAHSAVIDLKDCNIAFDNDLRVPIDIKTHCDTANAATSVRLTKEVVLAPHTAKTLTVKVQNKYWNGDLLIESLPNSSHGLVVPAALYSNNPEQNIIVYNFSDAKLKLPAGTAVASVSSGYIIRNLATDEISASNTQNNPEYPEELLKLREEVPDHLKELFLDSLENLTYEQAVEVKDLLIEFEDTFSKNPMDLGHFKAFKHPIPTGDAIPVRDKFRRTPLKWVETEREHIKDLLDKHIIRESTSAWSAMPVLVKKPDGSLRYCIDYRGLNAVTKFDCYNLPSMDDVLASLSGSTFLSSLDLASGYWQIEIEEEDKPKTAFMTMAGLYEFNRLAFGLVSAPASFQRCMHLILGGLLFQSAVAYLDDVVVFSKSTGTSAFSEHLHNLREVLRRLAKYNLKLKPSKCHLLKRRLKILGRIADKDGIQIDPSKKDVVRNWTVPKDAESLRRFIGFANFSREFVENFAHTTTPLYDLMTRCLRKNDKDPYIWEDIHQKAFDKLCYQLSTAPALAHVRDVGTVILRTDASKVACGASLHQIQDGKERLVGYFSRKMTPAMGRKCATQLELIAVAAAVHHFSPILTGRSWQLVTDHASLKFLFNAFKYADSKIARIIEYLSQFHFSIRHEKGINMTGPDALSRIDHEFTPCNCYYKGCTLDQLPCKGCKFCARAMDEWKKYETDVDDISPPGVLLDSEVNNSAPRFNEDDWMSRSIRPFNLDDCDYGLNTLFVEDIQEEQNIDEFEDLKSKTQYIFDDDYEPPTEHDNDQLSPDWKDAYEGPALTNDELRKLQLEDPDLKTILLWLQDDVKPNGNELMASSKQVKYYWLIRKQLTIINGVLYYKWITPEFVEEPRLIVPKVLQPFILGQLHDASTSLHQGRDRTLRRARSQFMWYKMADHIGRYVKTCKVCIQSKTAHRIARAERLSYVPGSPMERVALDLFGPISPKSPRGNRYVLVIRDLFTRFTVLVPLPDQSAKSVARSMLIQWISIFGTPFSTHSDQGSCFESGLYKEFCRLFDMHKSRCTTYHPIANSSVEKTNLFIANALRSVVDRNQRNWDLYVPLIQLVNNSMVNDSTGYTPHMLLFGREMPLPLNWVLPPPLRTQFERHEWNAHIHEQLDQLHRIARKNIGLTQHKQKRYTDIKKYEKRYNIGDYVYKLNTSKTSGVSKKLNKKFVGPYLIVAGKTSSGIPICHPLYTIRDRKDRDYVIHHDRLLLASDKVALPFWIHRQRRKVLFDVNESIDCERKRLENIANDSNVDTSTTQDNLPETVDKSLTPSFANDESKIETDNPDDILDMQNGDLDFGDLEDIKPNPSTAVQSDLNMNDSVHITWKPQYEDYRSRYGRKIHPVERLGVATNELY